MAINDLEKMDNYNPTNYVNNSEPDIDAEHLNKTENKLEETVEKANEIIDTLKALISTVQTNSQTTVPSSSLVYSMQQAITKNTDDIATANSNFDNLETALNSVLKTQWTSNSNEITVGPGSTVTAQFPTARIAGFVPIGIVGFSVKAGLTVYQCNTDTTNYTTNVYVRNDTASNIVNTSGQISALVLYAKTFR